MGHRAWEPVTTLISQINLGNAGNNLSKLENVDRTSASCPLDSNETEALAMAFKLPRIGKWYTKCFNI